MVAAFQSRGMTLPHIIGPDTAHKIHPDSKLEVQSKLDKHLDAGKKVLPLHHRPDDLHASISKAWLVEHRRMGEHWREARVQGNINRGASKSDQVTLQTNNVSRT